MLVIVPFFHSPLHIFLFPPPKTIFVLTYLQRHTQTAAISNSERQSLDIDYMEASPVLVPPARQQQLKLQLSELPAFHAPFLFAFPSPLSFFSVQFYDKRSALITTGISCTMSTGGLFHFANILGTRNIS